MNRQEFVQIAMTLKTFYPDPKFLPNDHAIALWSEQFEDVDYNTMKAVCRKWIAENKWAPAVSDLRQYISEIVTGEIPDWGEAWEVVMKAVRTYGMYNPEAAYAMMDEITREACRRVGFKEICTNENITASRAAFRDIYIEIAARVKKQNLLPVGLRDQISTIRQKCIESKGD